MRFGNLWPLLLLACLAACTSQSLSSNELSAIKRVAIISAIGNEMSTVEFAMIPINSEALIDPMTELGFDRFVEDSIAAKLATRFERVRLDPRPQIDHASKDGVWYSDSRNITIHWPAAQRQADTYIEVIPGTGMLYGISFQFHGVYMATHPHMFGDEDRDIGALYHLRVIDAATLDVVASVPVHVHRPISQANWAPRFSAMTGAQKDEARKLLEAAMLESLDDALTRLELVP